MSFRLSDVPLRNSRFAGSPSPSRSWTKASRAPESVVRTMSSSPSVRSIPVRVMTSQFLFDPGVMAEVRTRKMRSIPLTVRVE